MSDRCKHGVYVGDPGGPDYMCLYCENGYTDAEVAAIYREASIQRDFYALLMAEMQDIPAINAHVRANTA